MRRFLRTVLSGNDSTAGSFATQRPTALKWLFGFNTPERMRSARGAAVAGWTRNDRRGQLVTGARSIRHIAVPIGAIREKLRSARSLDTDHAIGRRSLAPVAQGTGTPTRRALSAPDNISPGAGPMPPWDPVTGTLITNRQSPTETENQADNPATGDAPKQHTSAQGTSSSKRAVSTLHIDGAALGKWALQHLERSLGRPNVGITGIDPRASVPRGRVSPF